MICQCGGKAKTTTVAGVPSWRCPSCGRLWPKTSPAPKQPTLPLEARP